MILATWNVNSLKSRLPIVLNWLNTHKPTLLLLQEVKGENEHIFQEFTKIGYFSYYNLQKTYNGVVTFCSSEVTNIVKGIPKYSDEQARFIEVEHNKVKIINVYIPNGNPIESDDKYKYKLNWLNALYLYVESLVNDEIDFIIAGDFNIAPYKTDVYNENAFANDALVQQEVKDFYFKLINIGLLDASKTCISDPKAFTWWDYRNGGFERNNGARIDHILLSPRMADKLIKVEIDKNPRALEKPSDHTPVIAYLNF